MDENRKNNVAEMEKLVESKLTELQEKLTKDGGYFHALEAEARILERMGEMIEAGAGLNVLRLGMVMVIVEAVRVGVIPPQNVPDNGEKPVSDESVMKAWLILAELLG